MLHRLKKSSILQKSAKILIRGLLRFSINDFIIPKEFSLDKNYEINYQTHVIIPQSCFREWSEFPMAVQLSISKQPENHSLSSHTQKHLVLQHLWTVSRLSSVRITRGE